MNITIYSSITLIVVLVNLVFINIIIPKLRERKALKYYLIAVFIVLIWQMLELVRRLYDFGESTAYINAAGASAITFLGLYWFLFVMSFLGKKVNKIFIIISHIYGLFIVYLIWFTNLIFAGVSPQYAWGRVFIPGKYLNLYSSFIGFFLLLCVFFLGYNYVMENHVIKKRMIKHFLWTFIIGTGISMPTDFLAAQMQIPFPPFAGVAATIPVIMIMVGFKKYNFLEIKMDRFPITHKMLIIFLFVSIITSMIGANMTYNFGKSLIENNIGEIQNENILIQMTNFKDKLEITFFSLFLSSSVFLVFLTSFMISKPIDKLHDSAKEIQKGNLDTKITITSKDEIGDFGRTFDKMRIEVKDYRDNLEEKIKEKTMELSDKVEKLDKKEKLLASKNLKLKHQSEEMMEINHDILKQEKQIEKINNNLEEANEELKSLDRKKDEFISLAAHELKTPLTSIKGFAQLLMNKKAKIDVKKKDHYLNLINDNTNNLYKLVMDVVDSSRIRTGNLRLNMEFTKVKPVFDKIKENMGVILKEKKIKGEFSIEKNLPKIAADPTRLLQVLRNLIINAVHFTHEKGNISLNIFKKGNFIQFEISDTGEGIPKEKQKYIFSKFFQADTSLSRKIEGSGLGLAVSKGIIELMGGKIWFKSKEGKGSKFYFTIPILKEK